VVDHNGTFWTVIGVSDMKALSSASLVFVRCRGSDMVVDLAEHPAEVVNVRLDTVLKKNPGGACVVFVT